jgi:hypothetical protein
MPKPRHIAAQDRESPQRDEAAAPPAPATAPEEVIALQHSAGNAAVGRLLRAQAALTDDERGRVQAARSFWQHLTNTPAAQQDVAGQLASPPPEVSGVLPSEDPAGAAPADPAAVDVPASEAFDETDDAEATETEAEPEAGRSGSYINAIAGQQAAHSATSQYDAKVSALPPSAPRPTYGKRGDDWRPTGTNAPAASDRAKRLWKGTAGIVRGTVMGHGPDGAGKESKLAPGRQGPIKSLELDYWLEALDPEHRPGFELRPLWDRWVESSSPDSFWAWVRGARPEDRKVEYMDGKRRAEHMVLAKDGKLWQRANPDAQPAGSDDFKPYDTGSANATYGKATGWAIFVISTAGVIYASPSQEGVLHHSSLLAGAAVRAAGEIRVISGQLQGLTPLSGHYKPGNDHLAYALGQFASRGVDVGEAKVGDVQLRDDAMEINWYRAADYLANGANGTRVPEPAGRGR